jgi:NADPH:quinone reductase-like Zn-dependent oxidoreductase
MLGESRCDRLDKAIAERAWSARSSRDLSQWRGSDLAGVVEEVGAGVNGVAVGDEVIGLTNSRASQAEYVLVEAANLTPKPPRR